MIELRLASPVSVFLNLTNACNLRCVYCSAASGVPSPNDLSAEELHRLIDELVELKVCKVTVTGGEPFVRTDALDLLAHLVTGGICISVLSNGTMIRPALVRRLVELGIGDVCISLDGVHPEVNDVTRGVGSFERSIRGVRVLLDHGVRPTILVTVTTANYCRLVEIVDELAALGVNAVAFNVMARQGRGNDCADLWLNTEQLARYAADLRYVEDRNPSFVREDFLHWLAMPQRLSQLEGAAAPSIRAPRLLPCHAAKASCAIASDGTVYPCNRFSNYPCGNVREESLAEIWRGERMQRVRALGTIPTAFASGCAGCRYSGVCSGGCRALAHLAFDDLQAPDPACSVLADSGFHVFRPECVADGGNPVGRHP